MTTVAPVAMSVLTRLPVPEGDASVVSPKASAPVSSSTVIPFVSIRHRTTTIVVPAAPSVPTRRPAYVAAANVDSLKTSAQGSSSTAILSASISHRTMTIAVIATPFALIGRPVCSVRANVELGSTYVQGSFPGAIRSVCTRARTRKTVGPVAMSALLVHGVAEADAHRADLPPQLINSYTSAGRVHGERTSVNAKIGGVRAGTGSSSDTSRLGFPAFSR
jgi:hypothetical protein